jgi:flagellar biosynthesis GTPase FlhF
MKKSTKIKIALSTTAVLASVGFGYSFLHKTSAETIVNPNINYSKVASSEDKHIKFIKEDTHRQQLEQYAKEQKEKEEKAKAEEAQRKAEEAQRKAEEVKKQQEALRQATQKVQETVQPQQQQTETQSVSAPAQTQQVQQQAQPAVQQNSSIATTNGVVAVTATATTLESAQAIIDSNPYGAVVSYLGAFAFNSGRAIYLLGHNLGAMTPVANQFNSGNTTLTLKDVNGVSKTLTFSHFRSVANGEVITNGTLYDILLSPQNFSNTVCIQYCSGGMNQVYIAQY